MLDERQAFKFGFLLRCADEGLSPEELDDRIKQANERVTVINEGSQPVWWVSEDIDEPRMARRWRQRPCPARRVVPAWQRSPRKRLIPGKQNVRS